jgi:hypothetical protein
MGKYDGPHFGTDNNVVSVWLANTEYKKYQKIIGLKTLKMKTMNLGIDSLMILDLEVTIVIWLKAFLTIKIMT